MHSQDAHSVTGEIGYILKSYPRMSETFIANEIYLLEQRGLRLRLFSLLDLTDPQRHAVVEATQAPLTYLPQLTSISAVPLRQWLHEQAPAFAPAHRALLLAHPWRYLTALLFALRLAIQNGSWRAPEKSFFKEFTQAGFIAAQALRNGTIRHWHAHFCHTSTTVALLVSRLSGLPFSFTAHAKDIYVAALNPGDLLSLKLRNAKFAVTCTKANQTHLAALGVRETAIHTIYHGLDTQQFTPRVRNPADNAVSTVPPTLLTVGRVVEKKGFDTLIHACRILHKRGIVFRCRFISGSGVREQEIQQLIEALGLAEIVRMEPAVTQEALKQIYHEATAFALPCQIAENNDRDGIPNVLVEAMASGLPVVSTNISGIPELIEHGVSGLLVPPKDATALADALARLLTDAELQRQLGQAARAKVCRLFDAEDNVQRLHELLLDCLRS